MSILEELYNGNISPSEKTTRKGSEYQKLSNLLIEYIEDLLPTLNNKQKELYEKIEETVSERNCISEQECFIDGFRIGAQMVWEILNYESTNLY